jgi:5'-nucleotidase
MRILVTNDDGINAPGLAVAEQIAAEIAGPAGEVWVVAPAFEQSGVAHCVSYVRPMRIERFDDRRFAVEGSPADCVLAGLYDLLRDTPPDLILSGVNRGHNVAEDTLYSGTIGAAMEGALHGRRAIAMSQYYGADNLALADSFDAARRHGAAVVRRLLDGAGWGGPPYGVFYNINFPALPAEAVKGLRATRQGHRPGPTFKAEPHVAPNGRRFLWLGHGSGNAGTLPGTDAREAMDGHITVTPLRADLTAHDLVAPLADVLA